MKIAALFSGGKDSTLTLYKALKEGHEVKFLIALGSENPDSYMFQHLNMILTKLQSEACGIPLIIKETKGVKEEELKDLEDVIASVKDQVDCVSAGALASKYQYDRVAAICKKLGLKTYTPLWQMDPEKEWDQLLSSGFRVVIVKVAAGGFEKDWLGTEITKENFEKLKSLSKKHRFHLGFEGGEAETLVLDCPLFKKKLEIKDKEVVWEGDSGYLLIKEAKLVDK